MKSLRIVAFLIVLFFNIGFAQNIQDPSSFVSKIREKDIQLKETVTSILNIDYTHLDPEQIQVVKETLEKWAKSLLVLNQLSLELFDEGLPDYFLSVITGLSIKDFIRLLLPSNLQNATLDREDEFYLKQLRTVLVNKIRRNYPGIYENNLKKSILNYLLWKFGSNIFPNGRRTKSYNVLLGSASRVEGNSLYYEQFFQKIDQYVKDYQSGKTTKPLKIYFNKEVSRILDENKSATKKLTKDEIYFLSAFNGLERYIKVTPKKKESPKEL
jgi:hypothetical protein